MERSSSQNGSSTNTAPGNLENNNSLSYKTILYENMFNNRILLKLGEDGFITPDEKAKELIKELSEIKYLYALKMLFENLQNKFSSQVLANSLEALVDTTFNHYSKESVARLELHLRALVTVLERICFSPIVLRLDNNFRRNFNQFNQQNTLHSLRDDETWFQEIIRRVRDLLKTALNITPGILTMAGINLPNDCSILSMFTQIRQSLSFKYPVASYYVDWRIMLILQNNLFIWSESSEKIISKKFSELVLMEYIWSFLEREWGNSADKSILDSQTKFDEVSNKVVKTLINAGGILNDLSGNEPIALPHTLWFGIFDLAQILSKDHPE
ncbi:unnamed protein product [Rhizophagus irregularis]|nr:unnamed protein product [Rhizophagus irregularis]